MNRLKGLSPTVRKTNKGYFIEGYNKELDIDIVIKNNRMWVYPKDEEPKEVQMTERESEALRVLIIKYRLSRKLVELVRRDVDSLKKNANLIKSLLDKEIPFEEDAIIEIEKIIENIKTQ